MEPTEGLPEIVRSTMRLEQAAALDKAVHVVESLVRPWAGTGPVAPVLRGDWLGHAVHPLLTDVAVGAWMSTSLLDVLAGPEAAAAAQRLVGIGVVAFFPTAWTGWAEWSTISPRDKRVGLVHAVSNGVAAAIYATSWRARRRGRHRTGAGLALGGLAIAGVGAYLGGHLTEGRRVATHHPAYDDTTPAAPPTE